MGQLTFDAPTFSEYDIEDAMAYQHEMSQEAQDDDMTESPPEDDEDLDAMLASYQNQQQASSTQFSQDPSPTLSDDDYDDLFAELIAKETPSQPQSHLNMRTPLNHSEVLDEDSNMSM